MLLISYNDGLYKEIADRLPHSVWNIRSKWEREPWEPEVPESREPLYFKPNPAVEALISQQFLLYSPSSYSLRNMKKEFGNIASLVCTQTHIKEKTNRYFKDRAISLDWCSGLLQHCRPERCPGGDPHCRGQSTASSSQYIIWNCSKWSSLSWNWKRWKRK